MAQTTRNLTYSKSAFVRQKAPNTVYPTSQSYEYFIGLEDVNDLRSMCKLFFGGLASWPSSLQYNKLVEAKVKFWIRYGDGYVVAQGCDGGFTPSSVTWNNQPAGWSAKGEKLAAALGGTVGQWGLPLLPIDYLPSRKAQYASDMINAKGVVLYSEIDGHATNLWQAVTYIQNNAQPYLEITYDDSVKNTSKVEAVTPPASSYNITKAQTVSWHLVKATSYTSVKESWTQSSGHFGWRVKGASSWNKIYASGSTMSVSIPAYTFPSGKTIEWYMQVTDNDGTTTWTATKEITTPTAVLTPQNSPTSGYVNPRNNVKFSWFFNANGATIPTGQVTLYWKAAGASSWTSVAAASGATSLTLTGTTESPAFPTGTTIQWYLTGTDSTGSSSTTATYTISTAASLIDSVCQTPVNTVEDGSTWIQMDWLLYSTDGYPASRTQVFWKEDEDEDIPANWHELLDYAGTVNSISVAGGTFSAGKINWKVIATNIDGSAAGIVGTASFICVDAPDPVQGLRATDVPITTISWQSDGQEAYEITIDGEVVRKAFGPAVYSWTVTEPLPEGVHTISVRVQGIYGLWSTPSETSISVGGPEETTEIRGLLRVDAELRMLSELDPATVVRWYRDGIFIGISDAGQIFTDRRALGPHSYFARVFLGDGLYSQSNTVTGILRSRITRIRAIDDLTGPWLELRLSANSANSEEFTWQRDMTLQHIAHGGFPLLERSAALDLVGGYNCAFRDMRDAAAFEALRGKIVIVKSRGEDVVIGMLATLQKRTTEFYVQYSFSIQQIETEDITVMP